MHAARFRHFGPSRVPACADVCFVETARYSRRDFARLLRNATAVVQVAGEPPGMARAGREPPEAQWVGGEGRNISLF